MFTDELGTADRLLSIAAGVLLLFLGVAMLASHLVRPLAVISSPIGRWAAFAFTVLFWPFCCCRTGYCATEHGDREPQRGGSARSSAVGCSTRY